MTDQELASQWDPEHRLAALTTLVSGILVIVGTALVFTVGTGPIEALVEGRAAGAFEVTMLGGLLLIVDLSLVVCVVALAHTFAEERGFGTALTTAVTTLATTVAATVHLIWAYIASSPEVEMPTRVTQFATWVGANLWMLPLFGVLVGATLLALALALWHSPLRFSRRLGKAAATVGGLLVVLAPFTGSVPEQPAFVAVAVILLATVGISALLLVALVRVGLLLRGARRKEPVTVA